MQHAAVTLLALGVVSWIVLTIALGLSLPRLLLNAPLPERTPGELDALRRSLLEPGDRFSTHVVSGAEGHPLELWWLERSSASRRGHERTVAIFLHGFGDDGWGPATLASALPELDALVFSFRGRNKHPEVPSTLGAWERQDVAAVVAFLESQGVARSRIVFVARSQGAGVALLALADLEPSGGPFAGALLESPFRDLEHAARNHLRGLFGPLELLMRPAQALALHHAGKLARFDPAAVSPLTAAKDLATPIALIAGDSDPVTPLSGVREIAAHHPDLTVVEGAMHLEPTLMHPGGYRGWATPRLRAWGVLLPETDAPVSETEARTGTGTR